MSHDGADADALDDALDEALDDADEGRAVLLEVVTPSGRYAVAALADVPLHLLAHALARLLGVDRDHGHDLLGDQPQGWDSTRTLRDLDVVHGTVVRLVSRAAGPDG